MAKRRAHDFICPNTLPEGQRMRAIALRADLLDIQKALDERRYADAEAHLGKMLRILALVTS